MTGKVVYGLLGVAALFVLALGYVRFAPSDPGVWHIDPMFAERTGWPNDFMVLPAGMDHADMESPLYGLAMPTLARRVDATLRRDPRVAILAGNPNVGFTTYIARSRWIGFPDYISIKVVQQADGQTALAIWSRARFGYSDLGVNEARVRRLIDQL